MEDRHGNGITFMGALAVLFVGLHLTGVIDWSWWAVLLPLWGPFALVAALVLVIAVLEAAMEALKK